MSRSLPAALLLLFLALWLAASYGVRYGLMEDGQWVGLCSAPGEYWQCQVRALLGLGIHFQVLAWAGLGLALLAQLVPGRAGWWLAVLGLVFGCRHWSCIPRALRYLRWCWRGCAWFGNRGVAERGCFAAHSRGKPAPTKWTAPAGTGDEGSVGAGLPRDEAAAVIAPCAIAGCATRPRSSAH